MTRGGRWLAGFLLLSLGFVLVAHAAPALRGAGSSTITFDSFSPLAWSFDAGLDVVYRIGGWSFTSETTVGGAGWTDQTFAASGDLWEIALETSVSFDPSTHAFGEWSNSADLETDDLSVSVAFDVTPNDVSLTFCGSGAVGEVEFDVALELCSYGGCDLEFEAADVGVVFPFSCLEVATALSIAWDGFDEMAFDVSGILFPGIPALEYGVLVVFGLDEKTVRLSPSFEFGETGCIDLYIEVQTPTHNTFTAISMYGIGLKAELGSITFEALSYFDGKRKLAGDYWEMYSLAFNEDGCCGPVSGELAVYFLEGGIGLFDVGLFESAFSIALGKRTGVDLEAVWDVDVGTLDQLVLGVEVSW